MPRNDVKVEMVNVAADDHDNDDNGLGSHPSTTERSREGERDALSVGSSGRSSSSRSELHDPYDDDSINSAAATTNTKAKEETRSKLVYLVGIAFFFLFNMYTPSQTLATTLIGTDLGTLALALVYIFFGLSCMAAPMTVRKLGPGVSLILGACCYCTFTLGCMISQPATILIGACLVGYGAGVLWPALGVTITLISTPRNRASNTGIFFSLFRLSGITGNVLANIFLDVAFAPALIYFLLLLPGLGSIALFVLIFFALIKRSRAQKRQEEEEKLELQRQRQQQEREGVDDSAAAEAAPAAPQMTCCQRVFETVKMIADEDYRYFVLFFFFNQGK